MGWMWLGGHSFVSSTVTTVGRREIMSTQPGVVKDHSAENTGSGSSSNG